METRYCLIKCKHDTLGRHFVKNVMQFTEFFNPDRTRIYDRA